VLLRYLLWWGRHILVGIGVIDNNVSIVRQQIRILEAVSKGKIPLEPVGWSSGLASRYRGFRFACRVKIRLNIVEGGHLEVRSRDRRLVPVQSQLFVRQLRHRATRAVKVGRPFHAA